MRERLGRRLSQKLKKSGNHIDERSIAADACDIQDKGDCSGEAGRDDKIYLVQADGSRREAGESNFRILACHADDRKGGRFREGRRGSRQTAGKGRADGTKPACQQDNLFASAGWRSNRNTRAVAVIKANTAAILEDSGTGSVQPDAQTGFAIDGTEQNGSPIARDFKRHLETDLGWGNEEQWSWNAVDDDRSAKNIGGQRERKTLCAHFRKIEAK